MRGPIDFIVVGFTKDKFDGSIVQELEKAVEKNIIHVLDMALVHKDSDGVVTSIELSNMQDDAITSLSATDSGIITPDDVEEVGSLLDNGTSAGLLIVEQLWAIGLKKAIITAGGQLLSEGRIHPEASEELSKEGEK